MKTSEKTLRLILGDQLNRQHPWFQTPDPDVIYVMMEVRQETDVVRHHIQKALAFFASMRQFAESLTQDGHHIVYLHLDNPDNSQSIPQNLSAMIQQYNIRQFEYQFPDEYRLDVQLKQFCTTLPIQTQAVETEHFLTSRNDVADFFRDKKIFRMESFYRMMRKATPVLMDGDQPAGGRWNYDKKNRQPFKHAVKVPEPLFFENDIREIRQMLRRWE